MSTIDEDIFIVPWVTPQSYKKTLTVIVLSQNDIITEKIAEALREVHSKKEFRWKIIVNRLFFLEDLERQSFLTGRTAIDFVIVAVDTTRIYSFEWTKNQIEQIHPDLRSRRILLVNAGGLPMNVMECNARDLTALQNYYKLEMLTGDVTTLEETEFLARRLLRYIEVSVGVKTGIPNLNVGRSTTWM